MKPIISHVTIGGLPACEFPLPMYGRKLIQCGFLSFAAARKAAAACKKWNVRAVKGKCPIAHAPAEYWEDLHIKEGASE